MNPTNRPSTKTPPPRPVPPSTTSRKAFNRKIQISTRILKFFSKGWHKFRHSPLIRGCFPVTSKKHHPHLRHAPDAPSTGLGFTYEEKETLNHLEARRKIEASRKTESVATQESHKVMKLQTLAKMVAIYHPIFSNNETDEQKIINAARKLLDNWPTLSPQENQKDITDKLAEIDALNKK